MADGEHQQRRTSPDDTWRTRLLFGRGQALTSRRLLAALLGTITVLLVALSGTAHAAYAPQGGRDDTWEKDGRGRQYCAQYTWPDTVPTRVGIAQYQKLLGVPHTGRCDKTTTDALYAFQRKHNLHPTGTINYQTALKLVYPIVQQEARRVGMSPLTLCGHLWAETRLNAGAVGPNGNDMGIAQLVPRYNPGVNPWLIRDSIRRMAERDAAAIRQHGLFWGPVFYWSPREARAKSAEGHAYRMRIHQGCF